MHREMIKTGLLPVEMGTLYDQLWGDRQHGDYSALTEFEPKHVEERIDNANTFLKAISSLITSLEEK